MTSRRIIKNAKFKNFPVLKGQNLLSQKPIPALKYCYKYDLTQTFSLQLLKALFGTNLSSQWESSQNSSSSRKPGKATRLTSAVKPGLYHSCFTTPYTQLTQCLASATFRASTHTEQSDDSFRWVMYCMFCVGLRGNVL